MFIRLKTAKKKLSAITIEDLKRRLDLFFKIYDSWGFRQKIRTIVSPGGVWGVPIEELYPLAEEFKGRGLEYWPNGWYPQITGAHMLMRGVFCMRETGAGVIPWNAYDYDPDMLLEIAPLAIETGRSVFGAHWPNFLRYNPKRSLEHLDAWVGYFKRQAEYFGCMLSRDVGFAANQEIHAAYSKVECYHDKCVIDTEGAHLFGFDNLENTFYISLKKDRVPKACIGGGISLYEEHNEFNTYKIDYNERKLELVFGE